MAKKKLWGGRFKEGTKKLVEEFTASIDFDKKLYEYDILGSKAHAFMLAKTGIISKADALKISEGLDKILADIEKGKFKFEVELEDIHMNIESKLTKMIGEAGKRLHTGRSRNDQVALDIRLYVKNKIPNIISLISNLQKTLAKTGLKYADVIIPGYTHLQRAQPVLFGHHLHAYIEMLERDKGRFKDALERADELPLGSGALAGTTFPIDREFVKKTLGFKRISQNSLDGVSDRDFLIETISAGSILMMHLSRLSEEIILWCSQEFNFISLSDGYCTGSSIMPQKKNPDVPELVRGKTGRVYGNLISILTVMKSLPLAYNKDMQEDKEPLFDAVHTISNCLAVMAGMISEMSVNRESAKRALEDGFLTATDLADYLVKKGISFREAHEVSGSLVKHCEQKKIRLWDVDIKTFKKFSKHIEKDIYDHITIEKSVESRSHIGGTALKNVVKVLKKYEKA